MFQVRCAWVLVFGRIGATWQSLSRSIRANVIDMGHRRYQSSQSQPKRGRQIIRLPNRFGSLEFRLCFISERMDHLLGSESSWTYIRYRLAHPAESCPDRRGRRLRSFAQSCSSNHLYCTTQLHANNVYPPSAHL